MSSILRLDRNVIPGSDETRLFAKVRNEARRLPFFLSYYRRLGVNRFLSSTMARRMVLLNA